MTTFSAARRRIGSDFAPVITLDREVSTPLHRQIYEGYRTAILERLLRPGQRIPSSRSLALELGISRIPILNAYSQLLAEGFFETHVGSGTFISQSLPQQLVRPARHRIAETHAKAPRRLSQRSQMPEPGPWVRGWGAFSVGQVSLEHFPNDAWARLTARHARKLHAPSLHFGDPRGAGEFRKAVAEYLRTARAVKCSADQVIIVNGSQQALDIAARVLFDPGDSVWVEEPGYPLARRAFVLAGCRLVPVPVDPEGLEVAAGIKLCRSAAGAYVTPSHQYPLGATMSATRRLQLLNWAQSSGSWIIEDDYDSEYRYGGSPIVSLQGLDANSRVIYIGTFSKTLFPSLRIGYLVVPADLLDRFMAVRLATDIYPPHFNQAVLTDFINEGHLSRHIRRTRLLYRERRERLVECLGSEFGSRLQLIGGKTGLHLVVALSGNKRDRELSMLAMQQRLWLWPLSHCYLGRGRRQGFILGFGSVVTEDIASAVHRLKSVLLAAGVW